MEVSSAGFIGPGRPPPPEALEAAARQGVDTGGHVSRLVSELSGPSADLILLVDSAHTARLRRAAPRLTAPTLVLGDLDPLPVDSRTIPDPWGQPPELFDSVFQRLDRCLAVLVQEWRARGQR
jgi:protein-tyrosine phosphatase